MYLKVPDRLTVLDVGDLTELDSNSDLTAWKNLVTTNLHLTGSDWTIKTPPKFVSAIGNHDVNWSSQWPTYFPGQVSLSAYSGVNASSAGEYGSFKINNALFLWLDPANNISAQNTFISQTLSQAATDPTVTWRFVMYHYPEDSCGGSHPGKYAQTVTWHNNYFVPYKVDLTFSGHNHYYERSCPFSNVSTETCDSKGSNNLTNPKGTVEIITGGGGAPLYSVGSCSWLEKGASSYEFVEVQVSDSQLQVNTWNPYNLTTPIDTLTINKILSPPTISKTVDKATAKSGDILNYTLNYSSPSGNPNVRVTDVVPTGSLFDSVGDGGVLSGNTITWTLGDLAAGASGALHFSVKVP